LEAAPDAIVDRSGRIGVEPAAAITKRAARRRPPAAEKRTGGEAASTNEQASSQDAVTALPHIYFGGSKTKPAAMARRKWAATIFGASQRSGTISARLTFPKVSPDPDRCIGQGARGRGPSGKRRQGKRSMTTMYAKRNELKMGQEHGITRSAQPVVRA
jgi:hypothetical protein